MFFCIGLLLLAVPILAMIYNAASHQDDERTIRSMVEKSIDRLNKGDITAFEDFWDENADYICASSLHPPPHRGA